MKFLYPFVFICLLLLPLLGALIFLTRQKRSLYFSGFEELKKAYSRDSKWYYIQICVLFLILFFYIVLLSRPYRVELFQTTEKNGIDIQIVFDVSYSMAAEDLKPNRLEVAKKVVSDFVSGLESDRVWLVLFAWIPFTSSPLTFDYTFVKNFISEISLDTIRQDIFMLQWTALGDGMLIGEKWFSQEDSKRQKVMILMTDWEANRWIDPLVALKYVKEKDIKVYTIGVWWLEKTSVQTTDLLGNIVSIDVGWIDEKTLKKIALETWWKYYRADSEGTLEQIFSEIGSLEKTKIQERAPEEQKKEASIFFLLALLCLQIVFIFLRIKKIPF